jgi:hypothetical protein
MEAPEPRLVNQLLISNQHASLARRKILRGIKTEGGQIPDRPNDLAAVLSRQRMGGILGTLNRSPRLIGRSDPCRRMTVQVYRKMTWCAER